MGQTAGSPFLQPEPRSPSAESLRNLGWILIFCLASQMPYMLVWAGKSTFMYDAFTTFSPWHVARLEALRTGIGIFSVFQENIPTDIWPSYYFAGLLRQIAAVFQPNSATAHAIVQAIHLTLLVPSVALLFRSLGVPVRYGALGGLVFALSGIHVSLTQHVTSNEALLYLVLSLWCIRTLLLERTSRSASQNVFGFAFTAIMLVSLVRVHHEAMIYVVPITVWTIVHLCYVARNSGYQELRTCLFVLTPLAGVVALCSVPMLLSAYEIGFINKILVQSYDQLGSYFQDSRIFALGMILPHFTGTADVTWPTAFEFGQRGTLSYLFAGTLTLPLLATVVVARIREGNARKALALLTTLAVLLGFTFGVGNVIHRALCTLFPFLIDIGHNYYGFHLVFLVTAYGVAEGVRIISSGSFLNFFACASALTAAAVAFLVPEVPVPAGWGFSGDSIAFANAVRADLAWMIGAVATALLLVNTRYLVQKVKLELSTRTLPTLLFIGLSTLITADMLRPALTAHFVPNRNFVNWLKDPLGGFNPSRTIVEFFREQTLPTGRSIRVLPFFIPPGGWQVNALFPLKVHLMSTPGDSGGNRFISDLIEQPSSPTVIRTLIEDYGVEYFWVARWEMDNWAAALKQSGDVELVFSADFGGDVYRTKPGFAETTRIEGTTIHLPWRGAADTVEPGSAAQTWRFALPAGRPDAPIDIQLPLMWHAAYAVSLPDGSDVPYTQDNKGRVLIEHFSQPADAILVTYPQKWLSVLLWISGALYASTILLAAGAMFGALRSRR
jgi:hypothetical protein